MFILFKLKEACIFILITLLLPVAVIVTIVNNLFDSKRLYVDSVRDDISEIWDSYKEGIKTTVENIQK